MDYNSIVFREFTPESVQRIDRCRQEEAERLASDRLQRQTIREDDPDQHHGTKKPPKDERPGPKPAPNKELAVGQTLPRALQMKFPAELIGKPIEEIDAFYRTEYVSVRRRREETFCLPIAREDSSRCSWSSIETRPSFGSVRRRHAIFSRHPIAFVVWPYAFSHIRCSARL